MKSINRWYNKKLSTIKEGKPRGFWSNKLAAITEKRNRQIRDGINKAAKIVINHCLENHIGTIVFGWNIGNKNRIELGKKNNSEFVPIPTAKLKDRISQLCEQYGIRFIETEESDTFLSRLQRLQRIYSNIFTSLTLSTTLFSKSFIIPAIVQDRLCPSDTLR